METRLFDIEYTLILLDGNYMTTSRYVAAKTIEAALVKLDVWNRSQKPKFHKIEVNNVRKLYDTIV